MEGLVLMLLASSAVALPASSAAASQSTPPAMPISYSYGGYPRIEAELQWGTKPQNQIKTIFDTGSIGFWTLGPNSTINDGSSARYAQGPCNKTVKNFYNWPASSTHSKPEAVKGGIGYSYGGNGKLVSGNYHINDTISFGNTKYPAFVNQQVSLANYIQVAQLDSNCAIPESDFDHSILGLAPFGVGGSGIANIGPSFRKNLRDQGKTKSSSFSMWFDKPSSNVKDTHTGTALFGAVPDKSKYSGELIRVKLNPPQEAYVGYYVSLPSMSAKQAKNPSSKSSTIGISDKSVKQCLLDSGTGNDMLPFIGKDVFKASGLINYQSPQGTSIVAWNGTCDSIPASATLDYTFAGSTAGKSVTIKVPIRSYAGGQYDQLSDIPKTVCGLSVEFDEYGSCVFGAPFFTAVFAAFNDDKKQIALAQGGVSTGAAAGTAGLGSVSVIASGQDIPGSV